MDIFELLALKGTRKILVELKQKGGAKYSDLVKVVGHSTTVSRALSRMEQFGVIRREVRQEKYRPVVYSLTEKGKKLADVTLELMSF